MAGAPGNGGSLAFLTQKAGPLPLWAWLAAGGALWWYFQRKQAATTAAANQQTDPAGNIGSIDPATGYVYGTPEDLAALAANNAGTGGGTAGQNATTGAQTYADNNAWGIAAVNWLVARGIDGATANQAVQNYLSSQPLTTAQQGDVNLVIQALGAPPSLPGPISGNPSTGTTTPQSTPVTVAVPNKGGWVNVTFPSAAALQQWYQFSGVDVNGGYYPAQGDVNRARWIAELQSLGATGYPTS
jgi:hypothetical protein